MKKVAVFDFDKTLISGDSGFAFFLWQIKSSMFKTYIVGLTLPLWSLFLLIPSLNHQVLKVLAWVAMLNVNKKTIKSVLRDFYHSYSESGKLIFYDEAINRLKKHRLQEDKIIILSAAPSWLVRYILKEKGIRVDKIIASKGHFTFCSIWMKHHCYGKHKVVMAKQKNESVSQWFYGYSDSVSDFPFLNMCQYQYLINSNRKLKKIARLRFKDTVSFEEWS
ncbi:MAG: HAD-IB family phosphatase [Pseudomonadota bacterium]